MSNRYKVERTDSYGTVNNKVIIADKWEAVGNMLHFYDGKVVTFAVAAHTISSIELLADEVVTGPPPIDDTIPVNTTTA